MKAYVDTDELVRAVRSCAALVPPPRRRKRDRMDGCTMITLEVGGDGMSVSADDGEVYASLVVPVISGYDSTPGVCAVDPSRLIRVLQCLPRMVISVEYAPSPGRLTLSTGYTTVSVDAYATYAAPASTPPVMAPTRDAEVSCSSLSAALEYVLPAAPSGDPRPYLNTVHLSASDVPGNIDVVAIDGHVMVRHLLPCAIPIGAEGITIPRRAASIISAIASRHTSLTALLRVNDRECSVSIPRRATVRVRSDLIACLYPRYREIIPREDVYAIEVVAPYRHLRSAVISMRRIDRSGPMAARLLLEFHPSEIVMHSYDAEGCRITRRASAKTAYTSGIDTPVPIMTHVYTTSTLLTAMDSAAGGDRAGELVLHVPRRWMPTAIRRRGCEVGMASVYIMPCSDEAVQEMRSYLGLS